MDRAQKVGRARVPRSVSLEAQAVSLVVAV